MDVKEFLDVARQKFPWMDSVMESRFVEMEGLYNEWNAKINVISRKDIDSLYARHILHSLSIAGYLKEMKPEVCDRWRGVAYSSECVSGSSVKELSGGSRASVSVLDLGTGGDSREFRLRCCFRRLSLRCVTRSARKLLSQALSQSRWALRM